MRVKLTHILKGDSNLQVRLQFHMNNMNFLDYKAPRHRKNLAVSVGKSELNFPTYFKMTFYINGVADEVRWC